MLKRLSLLLGLLLTLANANAQSPTLGVGLEALTMSKGTIDVQALTEIIMEKQAELKNEALKRFMLKMFPETNYTTKFYVQNCLHILLNEKNPQVIEKEIYELTTNYALVLGIAKVYPKIKAHGTIDMAYRTYLQSDGFLASKRLAAYKSEKFDLRTKEAVSGELSTLNDQIKKHLKTICSREVYEERRNKLSKKEKIQADRSRSKKFKKLAKLEAKRKNLEKGLVKQKMSDDLLGTNQAVQPDKELVPFGLWIDMTSCALSGLKSLTDKGFFRKPIDFTKDESYGRLAANATLDNEIGITIKSIGKTVGEYVDYHSVIQEFYSTVTDSANKDSVKASILNNLRGAIADLGHNNLDKLLKSDVFSKFSQVTTFLDTLNINNAKVRRLDKAKENLGLLPDFQTKFNAGKIKLDSIASAYMQLQIKYTESFDANIRKAIPRDTLGLNAAGDESLKVHDDFVMANNLIRQYSTMKEIALRYEEIKRNTFLMLDSSGIDTSKLAVYDLNSDLGKAALGKSLTDLIAKKDLVNKKIKQLFDSFSESKDFYNALLLKLSSELYGSDPGTLTEANSVFYKDYTALLATNYKYINKLISAQKISVEDIRYIEDNIIPEYIRLATALGFKSDKINDFVRNYTLLSKLMKISAVSSIPTNFVYNAELQYVVKFVANLSHLDKAETFQDMLNLFESANEKAVGGLKDGEFKKTYILFSNAIKKYTLVNSSKQSVEIDVVSFLNELQNFYGQNNHSIFGLYMTLGLNQNFFFRKVSVPGEIDEIKNIGFASEKLGLKLRFNKIRNLNGLENTVLSDVNLNTNAPFINEWYGIVYGSGLLYSLANTSTNKNFDYPHAGIGTGIRFYNALDLNFVVGIPFIKNQSPFRNTFVGIGLDIPLGEYLEKIGNKK